MTIIFQWFDKLRALDKNEKVKKEYQMILQWLSNTWILIYAGIIKVIKMPAKKSKWSDDFDEGVLQTIDSFE